MVRKKQAIKPVVAKPLNDVQKRNLVNNFVTSNINENVINNVTDNSTKNDTNNITEINTKIENNNVNENITKDNTNLVKYNDTEIITTNETNKDKKNVTKNVSKRITITKSLLIGKKEIVAKFTNDKKQRPNYNLSEDTIEKIEKVSEILGYKKAEFVDIYLNGTLTKILKELEKIS